MPPLGFLLPTSSYSEMRLTGNQVLKCDRCSALRMLPNQFSSRSRIADPTQRTLLYTLPAHRSLHDAHPNRGAVELATSPAPSPPTLPLTRILCLDGEVIVYIALNPCAGPSLAYAWPSCPSRPPRLVSLLRLLLHTLSPAAIASVSSASLCIYRARACALLPLPLSRNHPYEEADSTLYLPTDLFYIDTTRTPGLHRRSCRVCHHPCACPSNSNPLSRPVSTANDRVHRTEPAGLNLAHTWPSFPSRPPRLLLLLLHALSPAALAVPSPHAGARKPLRMHLYQSSPPLFLLLPPPMGPASPAFSLSQEARPLSLSPARTGKSMRCQTCDVGLFTVKHCKQSSVCIDQAAPPCLAEAQRRR
ncbi:hypothetical protein B0H12DRAFT_92840 [Mycena haematopus]|nr:hypothetical protein B0H12DRAFT_92840 [Mycena haematopus]